MYDALSSARDRVSQGIEKASDLIDAEKSLDNKRDRRQRSIEGPLDKAPNSSFFKFSEAQFDSAEQVASKLPEGAAQKLSDAAAVADTWEMLARDFAKLDASFESDRDTGKDDSALDKNAVREEKVALQDRVES